MNQNDLPRPVNVGGRPRKDKFDEKSIEQTDIETLFSEIPQGYRVRVYRRSPDWCAGMAGELFASSIGSINLDEIQKKYGGTVLQLQIADDHGKIRGSKTLQIADVPRANGQPIDPNFATSGRLNSIEEIPPNRNQGGQGYGYNGGQGQPWQQIPPGLPPALASQVAAFYAGGWQPPTPKDDSADLMAKKMVLDMMNAQSQVQMDMMRANMENQREMARFRREMEDSTKPKEPLSDVQKTITLLRELNGMKSEFGGDHNPTSEIIQNTAPILETAVTELINLQKLKVQSEIARFQHEQKNAPPLTARTPHLSTRQSPGPELAGAPVPKAIAPGGEIAADPVSIARQMGALYRSLSPEQQGAVLNAFINGDEEENEEEETETGSILFADESELLHNNEEPILDEEDRRVLNGESKATDKDVSNQ